MRASRRMDGSSTLPRGRSSAPTPLVLPSSAWTGRPANSRTRRCVRVWARSSRPTARPSPTCAAQMRSASCGSMTSPPGRSVSCARGSRPTTRRTSSRSRGLPPHGVHPRRESAGAHRGGKIHVVGLADGADRVVPFRAHVRQEVPHPVAVANRVADGDVRAISSGGHRPVPMGRSSRSAPSGNCTSWISRPELRGG